LRTRSLAARFLEALAEALEALEHDVGLSLRRPALPTALSLALTFLVAFSTGILIPAAAFISCLLASLAFKLPRSWIKPVLAVALWAGFVSAPLAFIELTSSGAFRLELNAKGAYEALSLTLRAAASTSIFTASIQLLGWRGWLQGLEGLRIPKLLVRLTMLSLFYIPLFLREALRMLLAREARMLGRVGAKQSWRLMATVVGDLLLRGHDRAWRLERAFMARSLHYP
jgi:cobalt/nickel transport system permease protein